MLGFIVTKKLFFALMAMFFGVGFISAQTKNLRSSENLYIKNGSQSFNVKAENQDVISIGIKQNGVDVKVKLFNPAGVSVGESDYPFSEQDVEKIFVVAESGGIYRLEITAKFPDEIGFVDIKFDDLKRALPADLKRAEAEKLFSQAQILRATGKTSDRKKSAEIFENLLKLWREIDDKNGEIKTLSVLSYLNRILGNSEKSLEFANKVLAFPDSAENDLHKSDAFYQIGQIQNSRGEFAESIATMQKALALFSTPSPRQVNILTALAFFYQTDGEYEKAQKLFDEALENLRQFPDIYNEAQTRHLLGLFEFNSDEMEAAAKNFQIAADLREKFGNRRGQAISLTFLGMVLHSLKKFDEALKVFQKTLPISQEFDDRTNQFDILILVAHIYREKGDFPKALQIYDQCFALFENKDLTLYRTLYLSRGTANRQLSKFAESRRDLEKAQSLYRRSGDIGGEATALYQLAMLESVENQLDAAKTKIERALQLHEYEQAKHNNLRRLTRFIDQRRRFFDLYIDILMRLEKERPNENFALQALQVSENARMRTLIWQYREALKNTPQSVDFQIIQRIQKVQQQIGEQLSLLAKAQSDANQTDNIDEIEKTIAALNKEDETLKAELRESNPNLSNLAQPPTLSLPEMQAELDDNTVLVEYSLGTQRSYLWIVGKNSFQSFELPKRSEIEAQAKNFYETLSQNDNGTNRPIGKNRAKNNSAVKKDSAVESEKLGEMLLIKTLAQIPAKRIVFATDGALNLVPFASLTFFDETQNKKIYLAEKFDSVLLPSLTTLHILRQNNNKPFAPRSIAIIADPVFSANDARLAKNKRQKKETVSTDLSAVLRDFNLTTLSRLPFTRLEAENIAANSLPDTSLNLDFKASRERLLNGEFDRFDILHFATHGFLNNEHPELSGLVLSLFDEKGNSQNGFLRTQDLYLLKIKPQMVVLSACQTGLGKQFENEGVFGLTRGFLAIGTPRIIATLWKVDDAATAELMARFYRALIKENKKPSAALQTAQNELRQIPRFSHPRFWAGFVLTGEWR